MSANSLLALSICGRPDRASIGKTIMLSSQHALLTTLCLLPLFASAWAGALAKADEDVETRNKNMDRIGRAICTYMREHAEKRTPPCAIYSKDGRPLLSWRVLILPYLDEEGLFNQFDLTEPWDSENN